MYVAWYLVDLCNIIFGAQMLTRGAMEVLDCQTHHPPANLQSYRKGLKTESCLGDCALTVRLAPPQLTILFHYWKQVLNWHLKILEPSYAAS